MHLWLDQALWCLDRQQSVVLVTVAWVQGSTPREAGARMLVSAGKQWLTIGGGHLEYLAARHAREHLQGDSATDRWVERMPLGPSLGQCCGGMVHLLYERLRPSDRSWLEEARRSLQMQQPCVREILLGGPDTPDRIRVHAHDGSARDPNRLLNEDSSRGCTVFSEVLQPDGLNVLVFGAGHVGKALVHILGTLPCRVTWVDEREDEFPTDIPANVIVEATDTPEAVIDQAPPGSCYLIMTHDHALDQRLCEQLLRRNDAAYFGLIGSMTKRRKFEHRFRARGIDPRHVARMVCPIGEPGITGKQPAVIAVAVAAQLLRLHAGDSVPAGNAAAADGGAPAQNPPVTESIPG